jgi:adenosylcobinamide-GDP ribazoletransferase
VTAELRRAAHRPTAGSRATAELHGALAAVCFLTRLPLGHWTALDGQDVARAGVAFPFVGAGIGATVGALAGALAGRLSALLAVVVALGAGTLLTGALHLDALADTADALGARGRERALEIMRDSTIGAFGAVAIALDLLVKAAALSALVGHDRVVRFAVAAGAVSRTVPVVLAAWQPYARGEGGTGAVAPREGGMGVATGSTGVALGRTGVASGGTGVALARTGWPRAAIAAALGMGIAAVVAGLDGLAVGGCAAVVGLGLGLAYRRWLGGVTGDALGAAVELSETVALVAAVALVGAR